MKRTIATLAAGTLAGGMILAAVPGSEAAGNAKARGGPDAFGLTAAGRLVSFDVDSPRRVKVLGTVRGLNLDTELIGIDLRPATGDLVGVGDRGGIYTVNKRTGQADAAGRLTTLPQGEEFGVDVNPAADALRIISDTGQNLRYSFAMRTTTVDGELNTADVEGPVTGMAGAAYTNNDNSETTGTALYDLNTISDTIALQIPANDGTITTQGSLRVKASGPVGFDIFTKKRNGKAVANTGYATLRVGGTTSLFRINLLTGQASRIGSFAGNQRVTDLAVAHGN